MRQLLALSLLSLTLSFNFAFAENGASLKQNMKQAGTLFKAIGTSVNDSSKNADNAKAADEIIGLFQLTLQQMPDVVKDMPESQQQAALSDYQNMINEEIGLASDLRDAFTTNDNASAAQIYQKMKDLKQDGHDKYNP